MEQDKGNTDLARRIAAMHGMLDQDGIIVPVDGRLVGILHAFDRSAMINGLGIEQVLTTLKGSGPFEYLWTPREIKALKGHETEFEKRGLPADARSGLFCVMGYDLETLKREVDATRDFLLMIGMRVPGWDPKKGEWTDIQTFEATVGEEQWRSDTKGVSGSLRYGLAKLGAFYKRNTGTSHHEERKQTVELPKSASQLVKKMRGFSKTLDLEKEQPEYAMRLAIRMQEYAEGCKTTADYKVMFRDEINQNSRDATRMLDHTLASIDSMESLIRERAIKPEDQLEHIFVMIRETRQALRDGDNEGFAIQKLQSLRILLTDQMSDDEAIRTAEGIEPLVYSLAIMNTPTRAARPRAGDPLGKNLRDRFNPKALEHFERMARVNDPDEYDELYGGMRP